MPDQLSMKGLIPIAFIFFFIIFGSALEAQEKITISQIEGDFIEMYVEKILREAYQRIGITVDFKQFPPRRALYASNQGDTDGEMMRIAGIEKDYPNLRIVPVPVTYIELVVFTKKKIFPVDGWQSLKPYTIAILGGIRAIEIGTKNMMAQSFNTMQETLMLVDNERYDIAVLPRIDGLGHLKQLNATGIKILEPPVARVALFHYLHYKHVNLIPKLTATIRSMTENGRIKFLRDQFIAELVQP